MFFEVPLLEKFDQTLSNSVHLFSGEGSVETTEGAGPGFLLLPLSQHLIDALLHALTLVGMLQVDQHGLLQTQSSAQRSPVDGRHFSRDLPEVIIGELVHVPEMSLSGHGLGLRVQVRFSPALVAGAVTVVAATDRRTPVGLTTLTEARSLLAAQTSLPALLAGGGGGGETA